MSEATKQITGGCLCGAVRYEIKAEPMMTGFCHCLSCQKLSGSGHAFHMMVPEEACTIRGPTKGFEWRADSGNMVTTSFCTECGSPLFGKSTGFPGVITIRVASLDDPTLVKPQMSVFSKRLQPWDHLENALPAFREMPPMAAAAS